jgi:hypothetical protein
VILGASSSRDLRNPIGTNKGHSIVGITKVITSAEHQETYPAVAMPYNEQILLIVFGALCALVGTSFWCHCFGTGQVCFIR